MKAHTFMQIAYLVSQESKCVSWRVGAIIEKNGRIISTGINGSHEGGVNCCDHAEKSGWLGYDKKFGPGPTDVKIIGHYLKPEHRQNHSEWSAKNEIHAELNAILDAAKHGRSINGGTMYVTLSPCSDCCKAIAQSGIKKLVYGETYDRVVPGWENILKQAGIEVFQVNRHSMTNLNWENIKNYGGL